MFCFRNSIWILCATALGIGILLASVFPANCVVVLFGVVMVGGGCWLLRR